MSYPTSPVWTPGSWIFDKNAPIAVDGVPVAQPNFTDSPTVIWTLNPATEQVTANLAGVNGLTFVYSGTVNPTVTTGLLTGTLYINTTSGAVFQLQVVGSSNVWVVIGSITETVSSVFGRIGTIAAQFGDYSFSQIAGVATASQIPSLNQISGSVTPSQVPSLNLLSGAITSSQLPSPLTSGDINNIITVDGVQYTTLFQALSALPSSGGTIDMRGNSTTALNLSTGFTSGIVDTGNNPSVTILLGPWTYTANQIILRTNLQIIGIGRGAGLSSTKPPTTIQSTGSNSTPLFVLAQVINEGQENILLEGLNLLGAVSNTTQSCFELIPPQNGGLWYSQFNALSIQGFGGIGINFQSSNNGINQFSTFRNLYVARTNGGNYALQVKGYANCLRFENCEFDGAPFGVLGGDGLTNIHISDMAGASFVPYDIQFDLLTTQWAGVGIQINGCSDVEIGQGHFEGLSGAIQVGDGTINTSLGVLVQNCWFGNGTGVNSGNGFIINQTTANTSMAVGPLMIFGIPDVVFKGTVVNTPQWGIFESTNPVPLPPALGSPTGFGNGSAGTAVTTTTKSTGSGPTAPQTVVSYQQVQVAGGVYWIPLFQ